MTDFWVPIRSRFLLGEFRVTAAADRTLAPLAIANALARHARGDWGDVSEEEREMNEASLQSGGRLVSVYHDDNGTPFSFVTEADRSATTLLLRDDYQPLATITC